MNEPIYFKNSNLPKLLGDLMHSNQFLKIFSAAALLLSLISMIGVLTIAGKAPTVLPLAPDGTLIERTREIPKPEVEIQAALKRYLDLRYKWDPKTVKNQIQAAQVFVSRSARSAYETDTASTVKFSTEKQVSQRVYPVEVKVDLIQSSAHITGDRITDIQGLRAVGALKLTLFYESGPRTVENPWGIYITKAREEQ
ncbi:MAG: hypothetical protein JST04_12770 [Bdellovibrionales bacterium]|nr:hypothetical protein [Bdellovibrionales bacterium]